MLVSGSRPGRDPQPELFTIHARTPTGTPSHLLCGLGLEHAPGSARLPGRGVSRQARVAPARRSALRSEEHTSELQSLTNLVCRLLLEKKNNKQRSRDG